MYISVGVSIGLVNFLNLLIFVTKVIVHVIFPSFHLSRSSYRPIVSL